MATAVAPVVGLAATARLTGEAAGIRALPGLESTPAEVGGAVGEEDMTPIVPTGASGGMY